MDKIIAIYNDITGPGSVNYWIALFALEQALAAIPSIGANSTFQVIVKALGWIKDKVIPPKA